MVTERKDNNMYIPEPLSWLIHFVTVFLLTYLFFHYNRLNLAGVLVIIFGEEIQQAIDWAWPAPWIWFLKLDTWIDIACGISAVFAGYLIAKIRQFEMNDN